MKLLQTRGLELKIIRENVLIEELIHAGEILLLNFKSQSFTLMKKITKKVKY